MAERDFARVDLCRAFKIDKQFDPADLLEGIDTQGIATGGCRPVLSHKRVSTNGAILSRVNEKNGAPVTTLLTTPTEEDRQQYPSYSQYVAGLGGADPMVGTDTLPYPAAGITYTLNYAIKGDLAFQDANPSPDVLPAFLGNAPLGFGRQSGSYPALILSGGREFDGRLLGALRPYHTYRPQLRLAYNPNNEPLTLTYDANVPEYVWLHSSLGTSWSLSIQDPPGAGNPIYTGRVTLWEVRPCLTACTGTLLTPPVVPSDTQELNGPSLTRQYCYHAFTPFTLPAYGGTVTAHYDVSTVRNTMVIYANADTDTIFCNGVEGTAGVGTAPTGRLPFMAGALATFTPAKVFVWNMATSTTSFAFTITGLGHTYTIAAKSIGSADKRYFEGICLVSQA